MDEADAEWGLSGGEGVSGSTAQFLGDSADDPSVVWKVRSDFALTFGIHRSEDGGRIWRRLASPNEFAHALLVPPADPDQVFVANESLTGSALGRGLENPDVTSLALTREGDRCSPARSATASTACRSKTETTTELIP